MRYWFLVLILPWTLLAQNPGDLIITEFMANPAAVSDGAGEWIEIYNKTAAEIDLTGWIISDDGSDFHVIPGDSGLTIPALGFIVIGRNADSTLNGGLLLDYAYGSGFTLANSSDEIVISRPDSLEIDRINYDTGAGWVITDGSALYLQNFTTDNNDPANWQTALLREPGYGSGAGDNGSPGTAGNDVTLSVQLQLFEAIAAESSVELKWRTASEVNNAGFEVWRANADDGLFRRIGDYRYRPELRGQMNSSQATDYRFIDRMVVKQISYLYKLYDVDINGTRREHGPVSATPGKHPDLSVKADKNLPQLVTLKQNYPNPFNPVTRIPFEIPATVDRNREVRVDIFNILGEVVKSVFRGYVQPGHYETVWDGTLANGKDAPAGIYISRLSALGVTRYQRMILLK